MISYSFSKGDEVHIWKYDIRKSQPDFQKANQIISLEEQWRANGFIHTADKQRYLAVHLFLRDVLSRYTGLTSRTLEFTPGLNNKPRLKNSYKFYFNLSYRKDYALLGISNCEYIGVDIEKIRVIDDVNSFSVDYFSVEERSMINKMNSENEKSALLFTFWAMKEAVIKALAVGFSEPLTKYNLCSFLEEEYSRPDFDKQNTWCIKQIEINEDYKAAFAIKTNEIKVKMMNDGGYSGFDAPK